MAGDAYSTGYENEASSGEGSLAGAFPSAQDAVNRVNRIVRDYSQVGYASRTFSSLDSA